MLRSLFVTFLCLFAFIGCLFDSYIWNKPVAICELNSKHLSALSIPSSQSFLLTEEKASPKHDNLYLFYLFFYMRSHSSSDVCLKMSSIVYLYAHMALLPFVCESCVLLICPYFVSSCPTDSENQASISCSTQEGMQNPRSSLWFIVLFHCNIW